MRGDCECLFDLLCGALSRCAQDVPIVVVNRGATRGDDLATLVVDAGCSETLTALANAVA